MVNIPLTLCLTIQFSDHEKYAFSALWDLVTEGDVITDITVYSTEENKI